MNYFELYPGDYLRDTTRLSLVEHGAYLRLLMAYYSDEQPLPAEKDELFRVVSALKSDEKKAVLSVADRFFPIGEDGLRHNARADAEIAKASGRMESKGRSKTSEAERQQRYRDRRKAMFEALAAVGVVPDFNIHMDELVDLVTKNVTSQGVTNVTASQPLHTATRPQTPDPIKEQEHAPHARSPQEPPASDPMPTEAGRACLLLRKAGCARVNPSHPDLLAALAEGVKPEAIRDAYIAAPEARNPFAYAIGTARGLHAEGAKPIATGPPRRTNDQPSRTRTALENLQGRKSDGLPTAMAQGRSPRRLDQAGDAEP